MQRPIHAPEARGKTLETNVKAVELKELWRRYKEDGDGRAREQLVLAFAPLVKYVAGRMSTGLPAHVEEADLISYGLLGLISAIERFDTTREIKFETYAISRIKGSIIDELRAMDWVPRSVRSRAREIERGIVELEHRLHRPPTDEELAGHLGITGAEFQDSLAQISRSSVAALDELWTISSSGGDVSPNHTPAGFPPAGSVVNAARRTSVPGSRSHPGGRAVEHAGGVEDI